MKSLYGLMLLSLSTQWLSYLIKSGRSKMIPSYVSPLGQNNHFDLVPVSINEGYALLKTKRGIVLAVEDKDRTKFQAQRLRECDQFFMLRKTGETEDERIKLTDLEVVDWDSNLAFKNVLMMARRNRYERDYHLHQTLDAIKEIGGDYFRMHRFESLACLSPEAAKSYKPSLPREVLKRILSEGHNIPLVGCPLAVLLEETPGQRIKGFITEPIQSIISIN
jgi:hypothetical protein